MTQEVTYILLVLVPEIVGALQKGPKKLANDLWCI